MLYIRIGGVINLLEYGDGVRFVAGSATAGVALLATGVCLTPTVRNCPPTRVDSPVPGRLEPRPVPQLTRRVVPFTAVREKHVVLHRW